MLYTCGVPPVVLHASAVLRHASHGFVCIDTFASRIASQPTDATLMAQYCYSMPVRLQVDTSDDAGSVVAALVKSP